MQTPVIPHHHAANPSHGNKKHALSPSSCSGPWRTPRPATESVEVDASIAHLCYASTPRAPPRIVQPSRAPPELAGIATSTCSKSDLSPSINLSCRAPSSTENNTRNRYFLFYFFNVVCFILWYIVTCLIWGRWKSCLRSDFTFGFQEEEGWVCEERGNQ